MGLDIYVKKILKTTPKTKEGKQCYLTLADDDGNYVNTFPEWTKNCEKTMTQTWFDWDKFKEETGIDINECDWHGEEYSERGCFMTICKKTDEWPEYKSGDDYEDYKKQLAKVAIEIDLEKVPKKKKKVKVLYYEEVGYQRKGLNKNFYDDYRAEKIGYYVWDKKELERYKEDYCDGDHPSEHDWHYICTPKQDFQENIIDNFIDGECVACFSW